MFVAALAIRVVAILVLHAPEEAAARGPWKAGFEATSIARSIAAGDGFASPWRRDEAPWDVASGPTAWLPPVYPHLLASIARAFGGFTSASYWALFLVQCIASAATACVLVELGRAVGEPRAGRLAGWLYALYPAAIWHVRTVWDTTIAALALTAFLWALFEFGRGARASRAAALGAGFGLALLVNPAPLSLAPVILWVLASRAGGNATVAVVRVACFAGAAFAVVLPWLVRNERALGVWSLRTNLGVELALGNSDTAAGYYQPRAHPSFQPAEFESYRELGEVRYASARMAEFRRWLAENPGHFASLCVRRAVLFWYGVAPPHDPRQEDGLRASDDPKSWIKWIQHAFVGLAAIAGAALLVARRERGQREVGAWIAAVLLLYPLVYYATHMLERYRFPLDPLLVLLAAVVLVRGADRLRARSVA